MNSEEIRIIQEKLVAEKTSRAKAEKIVKTLQLILDHNLPEKLGKCFYTISPEAAFESAYRNSPQSFKDFPECSNNNLTISEKFKLYKERKPFIRAICKYCRN